MVVVRHCELQELVTMGTEQAQHVSGRVLVSQFTQVPPMDPFVFYEMSRNDRFFWRNSDQTVMMAGSGAAERLRAQGEGRFKDIERQRRNLLEKSVMDTDPRVPCTGPVFFGGFAFDTFRRKTSLWHSFSDAELVLPSIMLTVTDGECWLTTNCVVDAKTVPIRETECLLKEQQRFMQGSDRATPEKAVPALIGMQSDKEKWLEMVKDAVWDIRHQHFEKIVLTREVQLKAAHAFSSPCVLRRLLAEQSDSFLFAVDRQRDCFLGASPERLVKKEDNQLISSCLAGSIKRGKTVVEDEVFGKRLLQDLKNLHEHEVVVDMIRRVMEKFCLHVEVPDHPVLSKMKDIQHLFTPVIGKPNGNPPLLSVIEQLHPTPALGGSPQQKTLEKIHEVEPHDRGWYGSPIGWVDYKGDGEFAVGIRSGLLQGNRASLFAGNGIVAHSEPVGEFKETQMKFRPMLSALGGKKSCRR